MYFTLNTSTYCLESDYVIQNTWNQFLLSSAVMQNNADWVSVVWKHMPRIWTTEAMYGTLAVVYDFIIVQFAGRTEKTQHSYQRSSESPLHRLFLKAVYIEEPSVPLCCMATCTELSDIQPELNTTKRSTRRKRKIRAQENMDPSTRWKSAVSKYISVIFFLTGQIHVFILSCTLMFFNKLARATVATVYEGHHLLNWLQSLSLFNKTKKIFNPSLLSLDY